MQLFVCRHDGIEQVLVQPPGFGHQSADAVAVHRTTELLFGYRKARHNRGGIRVSGNDVVNDPYRKNRKRFPGKEKRMNMLLSLEPLIYLKSITNGKEI
jgi:hypothetical protein